MTARGGKTSRAKPSADYHTKPNANVRVDAGNLEWARDEAKRRGLPFGDFMDGLITAERDRVDPPAGAGLGGQGATVPVTLVTASQEQPKTTRKRANAPAAARESKRGT